MSQEQYRQNSNQSTSYVFLTRPNLIRLSAVATSASTFGRGCQPSRFFALSIDMALYLPSSGIIRATAGSKNAITLRTKFGSTRVGDRFAASPNLSRRARDISWTVIDGGETQTNRSPLALGWVIARRCRSATSLTSTTPKFN